MKLILHNYRRCPFCIRTRIVLILKKIPFEIVEEPLRVWTDWVIENIEDKRVPILRIIDSEGEKVMQESNDINLFLDLHFGEKEFTPQENTEEYKEMISWWDWCKGELKPQIDIYKYGRNLEFDSEKNIQDTKDLHSLLEKLEEALQESEYLIDDRLTLADIAIIPFIRQIMRTRNGVFGFEKLQKVKAWANELIETGWFEEDVMKKIPIEKVDLEKRSN